MATQNKDVVVRKGKTGEHIIVTTITESITEDERMWRINNMQSHVQELIRRQEEIQSQIVEINAEIKRLLGGAAK